MESNTAAWITAAKAYPFEIKPAPLGIPREDQILVKNHAIAINPIDSKIQELALFPLPYPTILGQDVAGEVVAVGPHVTRFKKGDRVIGNAAGFATGRDEEKAFQAFTILWTNLTCEIPDSMPFEKAVVLPLGVTTAAAGLFQTDFLNLRLPTVHVQKSTGKTLLVWGGASSVGSNSIQLAVAAGYEVITTASLKNFASVKKIGASHVFDYNRGTVVSDLVSAAKGKTIVGVLDAIGGAAWAPSIEFIQQSTGVKLIATVTGGFPDPPEGVRMKHIFAPAIKDNHVGKAIFEGFLPEALRARMFDPAPEPLIAGEGLESVQSAVDIQRKGTSAQKVVVLLWGTI
ncbi:hypothetical protein AJ80_00064 [Polytolypa hystricis UAMH7299]|uniref:Enoyl reductase (ER) domain-containing protein n=1 Tax=Polytolypa hystricis (strain UAMH7299) TaxID=1447883 RepID=A0A2B7YVQ8_POLH7|nr:hypothetical protein AJ80_00064 [Polytolypa hystricis UAMH7299]